MTSPKPSFLQAALPARQHGVVLFVALIVMVALSLAAIALIRSVDTTTTVIGNLAFRQASILPANMAVEEAAAALFQDADILHTIRIPDLTSNLPAENYFASVQPCVNVVLCERGIPEQLQKRTAFTQAKMLVDASLTGAQTEVRYVIERMCLPLVGTGPTNANCDLLPPSGPFGTTVGDSSLALPSVPYYRVTIRVDGPQNTASFVQAMLR